VANPLRQSFMEQDVIDHIFYLVAHQQKRHEQKYHVQNSCI
jgi:hypothetical protein